MLYYIVIKFLIYTKTHFLPFIQETSNGAQNFSGINDMLACFKLVSSTSENSASLFMLQWLHDFDFIFFIKLF